MSQSDSDLTLSLRCRAFDLFQSVGMLLAIAGLMAVGLESLSFGHEHLEGRHGRAVHHHHLYLGEHSESPEEPSDHPPETPVPEDDERSNATVAAAPALFQPTGAIVLALSLAGPTPVELSPAPSRTARPVIRLSPPRGPPAFTVTPGFGRKKGLYDVDLRIR